MSNCLCLDWGGTPCSSFVGQGEENGDAHACTHSHVLHERICMHVTNSQLQNEGPVGRIVNVAPISLFFFNLIGYAYLVS